MAEDVIHACRAAVTKPGIELRITHDFLEERELVAFLASNTLNAFLYSDKNAKGLSSCIDFALAAKRPIAITKSPMFQHLSHMNPPIFVEDRTLKEIASDGAERFSALREAWSHDGASRAWNSRILKALADVERSPASFRDRVSRWASLQKLAYGSTIPLHRAGIRSP